MNIGEIKILMTNVDKFVHTRFKYSIVSLCLLTFYMKIYNIYIYTIVLIFQYVNQLALLFRHNVAR